MVWGGISLEARTELVVLERGTITADRYIRDCLESHIVPYAPFKGPEFMLMQDNARPHVARVVTEYLDEVDIQTLPWPARSPDLNPIEHVWDALKRRIRSRNHVPETLPALRNAVVEEWDQIPQEFISGLISSMPHRLEAVIQARGGNTRY